RAAGRAVRAGAASEVVQVGAQAAGQAPPRQVRPRAPAAAEPSDPTPDRAPLTFSPSRATTRLSSRHESVLLLPDRLPGDLVELEPCTVREPRERVQQPGAGTSRDRRMPFLNPLRHHGERGGTRGNHGLPRAPTMRFPLALLR